MSKVSWSGDTVLFARTGDAQALFHTESPVRLEDVLPDVALLCRRFGWQFFTLTWMPGGDEGMWAESCPPWHCFRWLGKLSSCVCLQRSWDQPASSSRTPCALVPVPSVASDWARVVAVCVTRVAAEEFAHEWSHLLEKGGHECARVEPICAALVLEHLADRVLVYLRETQLQPFLYVGAFCPEIKWQDIADPLSQFCTAWRVGFVDESSSPITVGIHTACDDRPVPAFLGQPVVVGMKAGGGAPFDRSSPTGLPGRRQGNRIGRDVSRTSERTHPLKRYRLQQVAMCRGKTSLVGGPFVGYLVGAANTYWGHIDVPLLRCPRTRKRRHYCDWYDAPPMPFYTVWAASLTALGWCVASRGLPDPGAEVDRTALCAPGLTGPTHIRTPNGYVQDMKLLLSATLGRASGARSILCTHRHRGGKLYWSLATRDIRWAVPLLLWSRHTDRRRAWWYVPRRLGPYLACFGSDRACFIVDEARVRRFLEPDRVAVLQRSLLAPGGLGRVLSRIALGAVVGGLTFVRDSVAVEFEEALTTAAVAAGARIEWVELSRLDQLVNPPPVRIDRFL